jgi:hypothetical protein
LRWGFVIVSLPDHARPFTGLDDVNALVKALKLTVLDSLWKRKLGPNVVAVDVDEQIPKRGVFLSLLFLVFDVILREETGLPEIDRLRRCWPFVGDRFGVAVVFTCAIGILENDLDAGAWIVSRLDVTGTVDLPALCAECIAQGTSSVNIRELTGCIDFRTKFALAATA